MVNAPGNDPGKKETILDIDKLTIGEAKQLAAFFGGKTEFNPFSEYLGKKVFIRSVTHHYTGEVDHLVGSSAAVLTKAAWIADDGNFTNAMASAAFDEIEMYAKPVLINFGAVLDITEIDALPKDRK